MNKDCWAKFIEIHNKFHAGSGASYMDVCEEALALEAAWKENCAATGTSSLYSKCSQLVRPMISLA